MHRASCHKSDVARGGLILFAGLPFVVWMLARFPSLHPVAAAFDPWFSFLCHRDPARTFTILGSALPVCARCTGIYAGLLVAASVAWPNVFRRWLVVAVTVGGALMLLDVATEMGGFRFPSLVTRFVTGFWFAWPATRAALTSE